MPYSRVFHMCDPLTLKWDTSLTIKAILCWSLFSTMLHVCPSHLWDKWLPYWRHMVHWSASQPRISLNLLPWPASVKRQSEFLAVILPAATWWQCVAWIALPWEDSGLLSFGLEGWCLAHSGQRSFESGWRPPERLWVDRSETETTAAIEQRHNTQIKRPGHFNRTYF